MKIAGSYCCSAMSCIVFVVTYVIVVFVTTTWADCKTDCKFGTYGSRVHERVYPIYKRLESIMINDTETLYQMREAFFPKLVRWSRESDPVNTVHIRVCGTLNETSRPPPTCNYNLKTRCWNLRWSSSPALNMISVDQLLAFDPVFPALVYSAIVGSPSQRSFLFIFPMSSDFFPCTPSESDLTQAVVLLSSWVSVTNIDRHIPRPHIIPGKGMRLYRTHQVPTTYQAPTPLFTGKLLHRVQKQCSKGPPITKVLSSISA